MSSLSHCFFCIVFNYRLHSSLCLDNSIGSWRRTSFCSLSTSWPSILPNFKDGPNGSTRRYLEVTGYCCLCTSPGEYNIKVLWQNNNRIIDVRHETPSWFSRTIEKFLELDSCPQFVIDFLLIWWLISFTLFLLFSINYILNSTGTHYNRVHRILGTYFFLLFSLLGWEGCSRNQIQQLCSGSLVGSCEYIMCVMKFSRKLTSMTLDIPREKSSIQ